MAEGIEVRHRAGCPAGDKPPGKCACQPSYRAVVRARGGHKRAKTFHRLADARQWRATALAEVVRIPRRVSKTPTVKVAADALIAGMESGSARTRSGDPYKPRVIRDYRRALDLEILPAIGERRLDEVSLRDVQAIADDMLTRRSSPSAVRNAIMPLRVVYRRALRDGFVAASPCAFLDLPAVRDKRVPITSVEKAGEMLAALTPRDRALWGCGFYAGLRRGELKALRWDAVSLADGLIHVSRSWDEQDGEIEPKSRAGVRSIPIIAALRDALTEHAIRTPHEPRDFVFGAAPDRPFSTSAVRNRALRAWKTAKVAPISLQNARHTCASLFIAAGVNAKAISEIMGHSSISITFDRYGHLMPGSRDEARGLVDAYLERALR